MGNSSQNGQGSDTFTRRIPQFSIVIPLYNKEKEIQRSIESCQNQTFKDFEIIVIDDGSTDFGNKVVQSIQDRRISIFAVENGGQGRARNIGVQKSSGMYVAFLDADDTWAPNHLETLAELFTKHKAAMVGVTSFSYNKSGRIVSPQFDQLRLHNEKMVNYLEVTAANTSPIHTNSIAIKRDLVLRHGGFDENLPLAQDVDLWIRLFLTEDIYYSPKVTSYYHLDASNMVTQSENRILKYLLFATKLNEYISDRRFWSHREDLVLHQKKLIAELSYAAAIHRDDRAREYIWDNFPYCWNVRHRLIYFLSRLSIVRAVLLTVPKISRKVKFHYKSKI